MKNNSKQWLVSGLALGLCLAMSGCRSYLTIEECEEQLAEFPPVAPDADCQIKKIAPLGAEKLIGSWHVEYVNHFDTYDGRMVAAPSVKFSPLYVEDYEFMSDGTFRVMLEICRNGSEYHPYDGDDRKRNISKFVGHWKYVDGQLIFAMDGEGTWDSFGVYHRRLTSLSEILPTNRYVVEWFSDTEILLRKDDQCQSSGYETFLSKKAKSTAKSTTYDEFGRECSVLRVVMETKNGQDYGYLYVTTTGSKILKKVR